MIFFKLNANEIEYSAFSFVKEENVHGRDV